MNNQTGSKEEEAKKRLLEAYEGSLRGTIEVLEYWVKEIKENLEDLPENLMKGRKKEVFVASNKIKKSCYIILATLEDLKRVFYEYYDLRKEVIGERV